MGETAPDFLNVNLNLGLTGTSIATGILLAVALAIQFRTIRYVALIYWVAVVLISVFGTLVTDNLTDEFGFPLEQSTILFSALLLATFALWYWRERTLSTHSVFSGWREAFYWLVVLFTFALGTAAGDLMAEALGLGYATTGIIVALLVVAFAAAWRLGLNSILAFWTIYILTRPLGASLGDYLTQPEAHGGLGLGASLTTQSFTVCIFGIVLYLTLTKSDVSRPGLDGRPDGRQSPALVLSLVIVVALILVVTATGGYRWQSQRLRDEHVASASENNTKQPLGDLTQFGSIARAMLDSVDAGDWKTADGHADEIEFTWDNAEAHLRPMNTEAWTSVDDAIDAVLREVRSYNPDQQAARSALQTLGERIESP